MALFRYRAYTPQGKNVSGVIDADSYILAKERLLKQRVMVTDLAQMGDKQGEISLPPALLLGFTRELAQLLRAGLPLYESLLTIEEKYRSHKAHALLLDLCDRLKGGSSLSSSMKNYPKTFNKVYLSMVQAAEQSASLPYVFDQLTLLLSRQQKLKKQLFSALAYPAFLGVFCIIVVFSLLFFVIPPMQELFEGRKLHPLTEVVLSLSRFMNDNVLLLFISIVSFAALLFAFLKHEKGRRIIQNGCLRFPFFKTIIIQSALVRFCRASSVLLAGGVTLLQALSLSRKVMKNPFLEDIIEKAEERIIEGKRLSEELKGSSLIPPLVTRMLAIAEETGKMAPMLQNIAEIYEEDLEKDLAQMTALLQPAVLLLLGAIVGLVVLSILLPLTDVSSFTS